MKWYKCRRLDKSYESYGSYLLGHHDGIVEDWIDCMRGNVFKWIVVFRKYKK
jgi:hypothetical protein